MRPLACLCMATGLLGPASAAASPADVLVVIDTSASMAEPVQDGDDETKLDAARRVAARIAAALGPAGHRVGLVRFAQIDRVAPGGSGPRLVHGVDDEACVDRGNLLVSPTTGGAAALARWVDGVEEPGNPELVALGDSPLFGTLELAFEFVAARRRAKPRQSCVNAVLVVVTDGADTCAGRAIAEDGLSRLALRGVDDDVRTIVLSFDDDSTLAPLVAAIGHGDDPPHLYGLADEDAFVAEVAAIEGRLAPAACVRAGVPEDDLCRPATVARVLPVAPRPSSRAGCRVAPGPPAAPTGLGVLLLGVLGVLGLAARRRPRWWQAALALAAATSLVGCGCGDDDDASVDAAIPELDASLDAAADAEVEGDAGLGECDTEVALARATARLDALVAAAEGARSDLAPLLDPAAVFAAVDGDPREGCAALARSLGHEAYRWRQRGSAGCLAAGRCNGLDRSVLLAECLQSHGINASVHGCVAPDEAVAALHVRSLEPPRSSDIASVDEGLQQAVEAATAAEPPLLAEIDRLLPIVAEWRDGDITGSVADDGAGLAALAGLDPSTTAGNAAAREETALREYRYVETDDGPIDPSFDAPPPCTGGLVDVDYDALRVRVRVFVAYALPARSTVALEPEVEVADLEVPIPSLQEPFVHVAIADAAEEGVPDGAPGPSSGCLRAFVRAGDEEVSGAPFFIGVADGDACPEAPAVAPGENRHLARITLRLTLRDPEGDEDVDRVLVDRYGFADSPEARHASGPQFSDLSARELLPMRADVLVAPGLPGPAWVAERLLGDVVAQRDETAARLARALGLPPEDGLVASAAIPAIGARVLGIVRRYARDLVEDGDAAVSAETPLLLSVVRRRGVQPEPGGGLALSEQRIFDVLSAPLLVAGGDDGARLDAQVALGALVTEAERLVAMGTERSPVVLSTGAMYRTPSTGDWDLFGSVGHEAALFPLSVQDAAEAHRVRGRVLVTTAGAVSFAGADAIAWWRLDDATGATLGEVRHDGTFYGGAAGVELLADADKCIWDASTDALADIPTSEEAMTACFEGAFEDFVWSTLVDFVTGAVGLAGAALGVGEVELGIGVTVDDVVSGLEGLETAGDVGGAVGDAASAAGW